MSKAARSSSSIAAKRPRSSSWPSGHALELDEVTEVVDPIEVDPHSFVDKQAAGLGDDDGHAEDGRERGAHLTRVGHLDQAIAALLAPGQVRALVGDQRRGVRFLAQLQPSPRHLEVGVALEQRSPVLGTELASDPQ